MKLEELSNKELFDLYLSKIAKIPSQASLHEDFMTNSKMREAFYKKDRSYLLGLAQDFI